MARFPHDTNWKEHSDALRGYLQTILTYPRVLQALRTEELGVLESTRYRIEKVSYACEEGSRAVANVYVPLETAGPAPAIVMTCGHGGSKSSPEYQYAGQLYASLGFVCMVPDPIGEEERHFERKLGTRAHDFAGSGMNQDDVAVYQRDRLKRSTLGKIVWDAARGIDYLRSRPDVDAERIGVAGNSLGGATAMNLAAVDERVKAAVICGWGPSMNFTRCGKACTRVPALAWVERASISELTALTAPHCAALYLNGARDIVLDREENGAQFVRHMRSSIAGAHQILSDAGMEGIIESRFFSNACHRPYFLMIDALSWFQAHLMRAEERRPAPEQTVRFGDWADEQGAAIEELYDKEERRRGLPAINIGAVYRKPEELACLPLGAPPPPEYTFKGWVDHILASAGQNASGA